MNVPLSLLFICLFSWPAESSIFSNNNPLKLLGKCISDHECKPTEFCDHTGLNPFGSCRLGYENKASCHFDRHCKSKVCHSFKCEGKRPVRDGPCTKDQHDECLPEQYCSKTAKYHCKDRKCKGACFKDYHCLSNNCSFFRCQKPVADQLSANFCVNN